MKYKLHTGSIAWLVHRTSGVVLALFIFFHFYVLSPKAPIKSALMKKIMDHPISALFLLLLIIAHSLNGLRLTFIDAGMPTRFHKPVFWTAVVLGTIIFVFGAMPILGGPK